jgi:branched-chain amino acid transport system substrate-binding protein
VDALNTSEFWSLAGEAGEGVRYSDGLSAVNMPAARTVVAKFRSKGYEPEGYTLNAYAAVQAWAAGAKLDQSTDAAMVAAALKANTVPTVIGDMTWDAKGDMNNPQYGWYVWHGGRAGCAGAVNPVKSAIFWVPGVSARGLLLSIDCGWLGG